MSDRSRPPLHWDLRDLRGGGGIAVSEARVTNGVTRRFASEEDARRWGAAYCEGYQDGWGAAQNEEVADGE